MEQKKEQEIALDRQTTTFTPALDASHNKVWCPKCDTRSYVPSFPGAYVCAACGSEMVVEQRGVSLPKATPTPAQTKEPARKKVLRKKKGKLITAKYQNLFFDGSWLQMVEGAYDDDAYCMSCASEAALSQMKRVSTPAALMLELFQHYKAAAWRSNEYGRDSDEFECVQIESIILEFLKKVQINDSELIDALIEEVAKAENFDGFWTYEYVEEYECEEEGDQ